MTKEGLKKPFLRFNRLLGHSSAKNHMSKPHIGNVAALDDEKHKRSIERVQQQQAKKREREEGRKSMQKQQEERLDLLQESDVPEIRSRYGVIDNADADSTSPETSLSDLIGGDFLGRSVAFTARVHHSRAISSKLAFIVFRQQLDTVQGVLRYRENEVSEQFVRWAEHVVSEGFVRIRGRVQTPNEPVTGCTIHDVEILIDSMHLVVPVKEHLPVDVYSIDRIPAGEDSDETFTADASHGFALSNRVLMANRISFLRTPTAQAIFRINSGICSIYRSTLESQGFLEIHTPKLQPAATESGAEVFRVNYFGRKAFLAQSPQLAKQMCISADMGRVFEIGSVFRAENSNTHRHLTEYVSMDLEMAIKRDYHEALDIIDNLLKTIFEGVYRRFRKELDAVKSHFPHDDLVWLDQTPRLTFQEAVRLLNESGWTDDKGHQASEVEDLSTRAEVRLGELMKEKFHTDYYIIDKFPASVRPFYTHLDAGDNRFTNSFDIFLRGQEITTGGQRIHKPEVLAERMRKAGIEPTDMEEYMQAFDSGVLPHAGCGIGLERVIFLLLNLGDVRNASLFPRDPKSLPEKKTSDEQRLRHPDADTLCYQFDISHGRQPTLPTIEKLIANYGDATNTSWLDDRYKVWRHQETGAAIGFAEENGYALVMGNPLCDRRQYSAVIKQFLLDLRKVHHLRPIWLLVSAEIEDILSSKLGWKSLSCVAEERVDVDNAKEVTKKQRKAEEAGVTIHEHPPHEPVPEEFRTRCDRRIADWKANRKGTQVHITEVRPWVDMEHRRYLWAEDKNGEIAALVVLHQLSPKHGYQIKFALDFPGAPSGTIESLISRSIQIFSKTGVKTVTFGAGATHEVLLGSNLQGLRARIITRAYHSISQQLRLLQKSEFREKFGTEEDYVYICYPHLGLGVSGARTLIKFFEDEM